MVVPVFLPHMGCNERCIYCHQGYITDIREEDLKERIDNALEGRSEPCEVGLFGGNIFGIDPDVLERIFSFFDCHRDVISGFRLSTKPVPLRDETIALFKKNNVRVIELGVPTFNDGILHAMNRGHTSQDLLRAYERLRGEGFELALQFMVGLPGEGPDDIEETVRKMKALHPRHIRIYPLVILRDTPLYRLYEKGEFSPISFDDALARASYIYLNALRDGIDVVNVGLTDNELVRDMVAGGFYHPAYGFLVQSRVYRLAVEGALRKLGNPAEATIILHGSDTPLFVGHKRENLARFAAMGIALHREASGQRQGNFEIVSAAGRISGTMLDSDGQ